MAQAQTCLAGLPRNAQADPLTVKVPIDFWQGALISPNTPNTTGVVLRAMFLVSRG